MIFYCWNKLTFQILQELNHTGVKHTKWWNKSRMITCDFLLAIIKTTLCKDLSIISLFSWWSPFTAITGLCAFSRCWVTITSVSLTAFTLRQLIITIIITIINTSQLHRSSCSHHSNNLFYTSTSSSPNYNIFHRICPFKGSHFSPQKWIRPQKWRQPKNEDNLKNENNLKNDEGMILKTVHSPGLYNPSRPCCHTQLHLGFSAKLRI